MPSLLCQVRLPYDSGLPTDVTVNSFSFLTQDTSSATLAEVAERLRKFYSVAGPGTTAPLTEILAGTINPTQCRIKMYDRSHAKPRAPIYDEPMTLNATGVNSAPSEVALVGSFRGPVASGIPMARRRGRVFIGPLAISSINQQASLPVRPTSTALQVLLGAMRGLMDASNAVADWSVHSGVGAGSLTSVVHAWVDDSFDTMRSRGPKPSTRISADRSPVLP